MGGGLNHDPPNPLRNPRPSHDRLAATYSMVHVMSEEWPQENDLSGLDFAVDMMRNPSPQQLKTQLDAQRLRADTAEAEVKRLEGLLNTPHTVEWFEGVKLEAGHQIQRWGSDHDSGKGPADWFWLIGYLAQKAMTSQMLGNEEKAKHHTISTGAALLNWFRAITGDSNTMRPGIDDAALNHNPEAESHEVARESLKMENQRITPVRFKCWACGEYHEGSGNLPCPKMLPNSVTLTTESYKKHED